MFFTMLFISLVVSIGITYLSVLGSHFYIDISRSYAASSYPGDITAIQKLIYQLLFPSLLLIVLLIFTFLLYLIFKNKVEFSLSKKKVIFTIPLMCTLFLLVNLYLFIYL